MTSICWLVFLLVCMFACYLILTFWKDCLNDICNNIICNLQFVGVFCIMQFVNLKNAICKVESLWCNLQDLISMMQLAGGNLQETLGKTKFVGCKLEKNERCNRLNSICKILFTSYNLQDEIYKTQFERCSFTRFNLV